MSEAAYNIHKTNPSEGLRIVDKPDENYIPTREAMDLLNVTSTQGVWNVIQRAERLHNITVRKRNLGTKAMPRYWLHRDDVLLVAEKMGKL